MFHTSIRYQIVLTALILTHLFMPPLTAGFQDDQDDPFALNTTDESDGTATPVTPVEVNRALSEGVRLIILSVRNANPSTPVELARAIKSMLNIQQYEEARRYLSELMNLNASDELIYELLQRMGPDFFLELQDQRPLLPEARQFVKRVFETATKQAYAPDRINGLISQLSDDDRYVRSDAFRKLRRLGAPAAAAMLNVCADETRRSELPFVQSALKNMGASALLPMIGAARADGTVVQAVAVGALTNIPSRLAVDPLYRAAISNRVPESVRAIAAEFMARRGLSSANEIRQQIVLRTNEYLDGQVKLPADAQNHSVVWNWNLQQQQLLPTRIDTQTAVRILAVDLARDVYQLEPSNSAYRQLQLLAVLDASKRLLGPNRMVLLDDVSRFVRDVTPVELDRALGAALDRHWIPPAIAAAELQGQLGDASVLATTDRQPCNLVQAMLTGQRHLQFAAAQAVAQLDPSSAFPGSSYFARLMTFLANSHSASIGLVLHPRPEVSGVLASSVSQTGLSGRNVNTPQQLFDELNSNPDVELVLLTDSSSNPNCEEIVQQIRQNWLSRKLPVGLLSRSLDREMQAEEVLGDDPLTWVMPFTSDPALVFSQIERLRGFQQPWPVSDVQRDLHARFAIAWLARTMANPDRSRFYQLNSYRDELLHLIRSSGSEAERNQILIELGTPQAQQALVNLASEEGMTLPERQEYADSFRQSVDRSGILLTSGEILRQYNLYNGAEGRSDESRAILGAILDTLESQRGQ